MKAAWVGFARSHKDFPLALLVGDCICGSGEEA